MSGTLIGFIIWCIPGGFLIALGIHAFCAHKPVGFWANAEMFEVTDVRGYNRATGKLFLAYGIGFLLLGFPLLPGQNPIWMLLSVVGVMVESIAAMVVYTVVIEKKYKK